MLIMVKKYVVASLPLLILFMVNLTSCSIFDPPVVVPCYGHIDSISYSYLSENSTYASIQDAWVYLDDNPVGAFQIPCTFPMIGSDGVHQIKIYPGVKEGGVSSASAIYPLYTYYTGYITMKQNTVVKLNGAKVTYASFAKFPWTEDFESPISSVRKVFGSNVIMTVTRTPDTALPGATVFQGHQCGIVELNATNPTFIGRSDSITLPHDGATPVWLEINYNSNNIFSVGLLGQDTLNYLPVVYLYPSNGSWNKIYIPLESTIAPAGVSQEPFSVYFQMYNTAGVKSVLLLDNIKLVY
jgi:hypothetical protein